MITNLKNKIKGIKETRTFINSVQRKLPFLPIVPRIHNIFDPRTFLIFLFTFIECKHNFRHFLHLYSKILRVRHPKCLLCTQTRSGTLYTKNLYKSAVALSEGRSGKPCYSLKEHYWDYDTDLDGYATELRNFVYEFKGFKLKKLHPYAVSWAHYPIQKMDLVDIRSVRPVFTLRNPLDSCKSWYHKRDVKNPKEWYAPKKIGMEKWHLISRRIEKIIYHFNYWGEYIKNKKNGEDYLCIKYEELIQNTVDILKSLLQFWGMEIDKKFLVKAAELNSYENTIKYILEKDGPDTKLITIRKKTDFNEDVLALIKEKLNKELIHDFGYKKIWIQK